MVNWHASIWNAPEARSTRLMMDADQTWEVKRLNNGNLAVSKYIVNGMTYEPGSASFKASGTAFVLNPPNHEKHP